MDWFRALAHSQSAFTGIVTVYPAARPGGIPTVSVDYQLHISDRYDWDREIIAEVGPFKVPHALLREMNYDGVASEYNITGRSSVQRYTGPLPSDPTAVAPTQPTGRDGIPLTNTRVTALAAAVTGTYWAVQKRRQRHLQTVAADPFRSQPARAPRTGVTGWSKGGLITGAIVGIFVGEFAGLGALSPSVSTSMVTLAVMAALVPRVASWVVKRTSRPDAPRAPPGPSARLAHRLLTWLDTPTGRFVESALTGFAAMVAIATPSFGYFYAAAAIPPIGGRATPHARGEDWNAVTPADLGPDVTDLDWWRLVGVLDRLGGVKNVDAQSLARGAASLLPPGTPEWVRELSAQAHHAGLTGPDVTSVLERLVSAGWLDAAEDARGVRGYRLSWKLTALFDHAPASFVTALLANPAAVTRAADLVARPLSHRYGRLTG
ncbi:MAG: hypothetical protein ACRDXB_04510, partial [Actinomycetes bacterium]